MLKSEVYPWFVVRANTLSLSPKPVLNQALPPEVVEARTPEGPISPPLKSEHHQLDVLTSGVIDLVISAIFYFALGRLLIM